jgi:hypothetical protein
MTTLPGIKMTESTHVHLYERTRGHHTLVACVPDRDAARGFDPGHDYVWREVRGSAERCRVNQS